MTETFPASQIQQKRPSPLGSLFARQVPQVLVTYIGASWGGVQFVDWLTERYLLSPALTDLFVYIAVLAFPSVFLLAYFRGEPGQTPWTWSEKIGIPLNLLVAVAVLVVNFQGKELGAINQTVTVKDGNGRTIEREVPKSAFRRRMALLFFENTSGNKNLDWLQQGIPHVLWTDLAQDLYLDPRDGYDLAERIKKASFSHRDVLALGLERDIASYYNLDYIVTGTFTKVGDQYRLKVNLYNTQRVKRLASRTYQGTDLFEVVDEMSVQLKRDVGVPDQHIDSVIDFPVAEILTRSLPALEYYIAGRNVYDFDRDYDQAGRHFERAAVIDPTFATAYVWQFGNFFGKGQFDAANAASRKAKRYIFKLNERDQFRLNAQSFFATGQTGAELSVLKQWVTLYPEDIQAHLRLGSYYTKTAQIDKAAASYNRILEIDPEQHDYLITLGNLYAEAGRYQEALTSYQKYGERLPNQTKSLLGMAETYLAMGEFAKAQASYQQALSLDPDSVMSLLGLGDIQMRKGNLDQALKQYETALRQSQLPAEMEQAYFRLSRYYELRGQWQKVLENLPILMAARTRTSSPINALLVEAVYAEAYVTAGRKDEAFSVLKSIETRVEPTPVLRLFVLLGYLSVYLTLKDAGRAEPLVAQVEKIIKDYGLNQLKRAEGLTKNRAMIAELRGDHRRALQIYRQYLQEDPTSVLTNIDIGREHRRLKDYNNAQTTLQKALNFYPSHPEAHYELADVYAEQGNRAEALREVRLALKVWADADPSYDLARKARELEARLR